MVVTASNGAVASDDAAKHVCWIARRRSTFAVDSHPAMKSATTQSSPVDRFKEAIHQRDTAGLRRVLAESEEARAAINEPLFGFGSPALVYVAGHGDVGIVDVLLEFGADPNRKSDWWAGGFHPLYGAKGAVVDRLIEAGAIPDACAAASLDRPDVLARLLRDDPARVHERGGDGQTPLHFARSRRVVDMLLEAGADIDARDVDHRSTAADWMVGKPGDPANRTELAAYLVERGASADIFMVAALGLTDRASAMLGENPSLLSLRTGQGVYGEQPPSSFHIYLWTLGSNLSPLQVAGEFGRAETVRVMESFASPVERLLLACHAGRGDEARDIARSNPGYLDLLDDTQRRALTDEAWAANAPAVELLLELGFDPSIGSASGPRGGNALHCAAWEGSVDCVKAILRYPAGRALVNVRESNWNGTPLSWCCHGSNNCGNANADHAEVARLLIAGGADVTAEMAAWECGGGMQEVLKGAVRVA
jgi:ankyrin repeat protein